MQSEQLRVLYVHDHKFRHFKKKYFSSGNFSDDTFSRYVPLNSKIIVISRMIDVEDESNLSEITLKNVFFSPVTGSSFGKILSVHLLRNIKLITDSIRSSDFIIVRAPSVLSNLTLTLNLLYKKKYFVECVGDGRESLLSINNNPSLLLRLYALCSSELAKIHIKRADGVIYVTKFSLQKKYPNDKLTSYASNVELKVDDRQLEYESYFKNAGDIFKIGLIGSFNNHYKGLDDAIKAMKILSQRGLKVELHILGSGTLEDYYKSLSKDLGIDKLIFFHGIVKPGKDVINWLEKLDIYIQPSHTEGLPRALIEAMSVGLPAVATDIGGMSELLSKDVLIQPRDSCNLAEKIHSLILSQQLRFRLGLENYNTAKNYDKSILNERRYRFWQKARDVIYSNSKKHS